MQRFLSIFIPLIFISIILSGCVKMEDAIVKTIMDWEISASGLTQNKVNVAGGDAISLLKLLDLLEENEDIQKVYTNFEIEDDELLASSHEVLSSDEQMWI